MPTISEINSEARDLCDANSTSYPADTLLRRINEAYETVVGLLINVDGNWQFDDTNNTDLPIGTQTLIADQTAYTFNDKFLQLVRLEIKDAGGIWHILTPIDQSEFSNVTPLEIAFPNSGMPEFYDKVSDDTFKLYPAPSATYCTLTSGLRITFKRTASVFTSAEVATGTKLPGFISTYHYILAYMAAIPYCMKYKKDRVGLYEKRVDELKKGLIEAYGVREKDKRKIMTMAKRAYK